MKPNRNLAIAAAALLLAGAGGAAFAHPHPDGDGEKVNRFVIVDEEGEHRAKGKGERVRRFEIIRDGKSGHHAKGERVRRFEIIRDGKGEHHARGDRVRRFEMHGPRHAIDCDGGDKIEESAGDGDRKTKVILCRKGAPTAATAKHLEEALARIRSDDHLSDEQKARIETALRSAIDRARSTR